MSDRDEYPDHYERWENYWLCGLYRYAIRGDVKAMNDMIGIVDLGDGEEMLYTFVGTSSMSGNFISPADALDSDDIETIVIALKNSGAMAQDEHIALNPWALKGLLLRLNDD